MRYFLGMVLMAVSSTVLVAQTTLEYKLKKDAVFTIRQNAQQIITQEIDGAEHELTNTIDGILEFKVLGERNGTYDIALTFKDLNLKMISSIQGELMNVKAKEVVEDDMQSQIFNSLLNSPVEMVLAKSGDILEVRGGVSLVAKMANASGLQDEFSLNMMKKSLQKEFGSEALSNNYKQMTYIYPTHKIKKGDHWENTFYGKLEANNTWTLDSISETNASISGVAQIKMNVTEPATTMKLDGEQQTHIITDLSSGFIKKMVVEGFSKGSSTMTQLGEQEIPTTIKSTISYDLIDNFTKPLNN